MVQISTGVLTRRGALRAVLLLFLFFECGGLARAADSGRAHSEPPQAQPGPHSFDYPERVEYVASWNGIPLASAEVRVAPTWVEGKKLYEVRISAETWSYLDPIWKMRDRVEASFEAETAYPRRFTFRQRENRKSVDTIANFDLPGQKWIIHRQKGSKTRDYELIAPRAFDPVSAAYFARTLDFKIGNSVRLEVFGGKSLYAVILNVVAHERIVVRGNEFNTYKIVPRIFNLSRSGLAEKVRQASIWISADEARMPVKITSQVSIGSVSIEMVRKSAGAL